MRVRPRYFVFVLLAVLPLTGCLFRSHDVQKPFSTAALKSASLEELVQNINSSASRLQSLRATVDIDTSATKPKKGKANEYKVTDNPQISGWVLVRKPEMLRLIGYVPVVRNTMFDMVSNGKSFELSIPVQNKFIVGKNQISKPSPQPLENLRPQHIFDALLLKPIDPQNEIAVLEQNTEIVKDPKSHKDVEQPDYEVLVIRKEDNNWYLSRDIFFNRVDLLPHRQLIYNRDGQVTTDAHYENFMELSGVQFPSIIQIQRPIENYWIQLSVLKDKLHLNEPLKDNQFALSRPSGSQFINLDQKNGNTTALVGQPSQDKPKQQQ